jgi:SAM-dependent methyltransferase
VRAWSQELPAGASILELGCGSGLPISRTLDELGFALAGIDASPTLMAAFRHHIPNAAWACEPAEDSSFFDSTFDAILAIGLLFLLPADAQREVIRRVGEHLGIDGRFLFTAPHQVCEWTDVLTGLQSRSLGTRGYETALRTAGMSIVETYTDEGENNYFAARKI